MYRQSNSHAARAHQPRLQTYIGVPGKISVYWTPVNISRIQFPQAYVRVAARSFVVLKKLSTLSKN
jgi:hypothetical protein